jgi:hypothetical protein
MSTALIRAVNRGIRGAALVDRDGRAVATAGNIDQDEAMPLAALVMYRLKSQDLAARLFAGEVLTLSLDDREVAVAVAKRQLFVVAVLGEATPPEVMTELRTEVEALLASDRDDFAELPPWSRGGGGGSGSGPAELPVVELGVTVRRDRGKPN